MPDSIKFIKKVIILLVILIILFLTINQIYIHTILNKKNIYRNQEQFEKFKQVQDPEILFFGDSLPVHDINPEHIPGAFNLATPGESIEQTYYKTKWVVLNEPSVEVFVLEYNYHLFNYDRIKPYYDEWYWKNFMSFNELSSVSDVSITNLYITTSFPVIGKGEEIYQFFSDSRETTIIKNGWYEDDSRFIDDGRNMTEVGEMRAYNQFKNYPDVRNDTHVEEFLEILYLLKDEGKNVVLIKYPLTDVYLSPLEREVNIVEQYEDVDNIISGLGIIVLDYRELFRYNQSLFIDSDHLNTMGSEIFSKKIYEDIQNNL